MPRKYFACLSTLLVSTVGIVGCKKGADVPAQPDANIESTDIMTDDIVTDGGPIGPPESYEISADGLLAAVLPTAELEEGWVQLFDGESLFGWFVVGKANWRIEDGSLKVDRGEKSFLCSSFQLSDYELTIDFRCDAKTNSGIFLRTTPQPESVAEDCLELNIAPTDNPFPTGSFVQRQKLEPSKLGDFDPTAWHTYQVRLAGDNVEVFLDGKKIMELSDVDTEPTGHISLQHNEGRVEFRNIRLRPIESQALKLDEHWEDDWTKSAKEESTFDVSAIEDGLLLTGGLGQIQSKAHFGDFLLQGRYTLARPEVNSGIFFRCVPDAMLDGYECQVNHATTDGDVLRPADAGAGAIFRRQPARIVVGDGTSPTYITLLANGPQMTTWVNGLQVADFRDTRDADENPRRGLRLEAGPISLQGHDDTTEIVFHSLEVTEL